MSKENVVKAVNNVKEKQLTDFRDTIFKSLNQLSKTAVDQKRQEVAATLVKKTEVE